MRRTWIGGLLVVLLFAGVAAADAINSTAGKNNIYVFPFMGAAGYSATTVAITPHGAWQGNNPDGSTAVWISYAKTGIAPDNVFQPQRLTGSGNELTDAVAVVTEEFWSQGGVLDLKVWADDTSMVVLDGNILMHANFSQSICANGPIGCEPFEFMHFSEALTAGNHTLQMYMYQVGDGTNNDTNPFGLMYEGTAPIPEPGSLVLFGTGLLGLCGLWRRSR